MKLTLHSDPAGNAIRACQPGEIRIGERTYTRSLVVSATALIEDWPPRAVSQIRAAHLDDVLALQPEILLLGTGARLEFPPAQLLQSIQHAGIGVEVMDTAAACRTFNVLLSEDRRVAAALIIP